MMDGTPVDPAQKFIIATNNYRAGGSGGLAELKNAKVVVDSPFENRQILMDYISAQRYNQSCTRQQLEDCTYWWKSKISIQCAPDALNYLGQQPNVKDLGVSTTKSWL